MPQVLFAYHLKALKLPTFLHEHDKLARQCAAEGVDHATYLLWLSELELLDRERRMIERRIHQARLFSPRVTAAPTGVPVDLRVLEDDHHAGNSVPIRGISARQ